MKSQRFFIYFFDFFTVFFTKNKFFCCCEAGVPRIGISIQKRRIIKADFSKTEVEILERIELHARIVSVGTAVGKKEGEGPLGRFFDLCDPDDKFGMKTWESAESEMQRLAFNVALGRAKIRDTDVGALFAGDLLNQCVGSAYGLLSFDIP